MECTGVRTAVSVFFSGEHLTDEEIKEEVRKVWGSVSGIEIYRNDNKAVAICGLLNDQKRNVNWTITVTPLAMIVKHTREDIKYIFPFGSTGWIDIESKDYKATFYTVGKLEKWR